MQAPPGKIVLPPISPLFASHSNGLHSPELMQMSGLQTPTSPCYFLNNVRTPTSVTSSFFGSALTSSSPVKKECRKVCDGDSVFGSGGDDKLRLSRERNRLHAQRTRIRKRELLESLKERIASLQKEHEMLSQAYEFHATAVCLLSLGSSEEQRESLMAHLERYCREELEADFAQLQKARHVQIELEVDADTVALVDVNSRGGDDPSGSNTCMNDADHDESCQLLVDENTSSCTCGGTLSPQTTVKRPHSGNANSKEERERLRRERNRLHARRARLRKKLILERSQQAVEDLRERNQRLRERLHALIANIYGSKQCEAAAVPSIFKSA